MIVQMDAANATLLETFATAGMGQIVADALTAASIPNALVHNGAEGPFPPLRLISKGVGIFVPCEHLSAARWVYRELDAGATIGVDCVFRSLGAFEIPARDLVVVYGDLVEARATVGMIIWIPENRSGLGIEIANIEFVDRTHGESPRALFAKALTARVRTVATSQLCGSRARVILAVVRPSNQPLQLTVAVARRRFARPRSGARS